MCISLTSQHSTSNQCGLPQSNSSWTVAHISPIEHSVELTGVLQASRCVQATGEVPTLRMHRGAHRGASRHVEARRGASRRVEASRLHPLRDVTSHRLRMTLRRRALASRRRGPASSLDVEASRPGLRVSVGRLRGACDHAEPPRPRRRSRLADMIVQLDDAAGASRMRA